MDLYFGRQLRFSHRTAFKLVNKEVVANWLNLFAQCISAPTWATTHNAYSFGKFQTQLIDQNVLTKANFTTPNGIQFVGQWTDFLELALFFWLVDLVALFTCFCAFQTIACRFEISEVIVFQRKRRDELRVRIKRAKNRNFKVIFCANKTRSRSLSSYFQHTHFYWCRE